MQGVKRCTQGHTAGVQLLVKNPSVIFQISPEAIIKAVPGGLQGEGCPRSRHRHTPDSVPK